MEQDKTAFIVALVVTVIILGITAHVMNGRIEALEKDSASMKQEIHLLQKIVGGTE